MDTKEKDLFRGAFRTTLDDGTCLDSNLRCISFNNFLRKDGKIHWQFESEDKKHIFSIALSPEIVDDFVLELLSQKQYVTKLHKS